MEFLSMKCLPVRIFQFVFVYSNSKRSYILEQDKKCPNYEHKIKPRHCQQRSRKIAPSIPFDQTII